MWVRIQFALLVQACALCLLTSSLAQQTQEPVESLSSPPPSLVPAKMPAGPVLSLYQNGELTIEAQNANLRDVLHVVSSQTGALIDIPPGPDERVVGVFGPGRPHDVLASLLNGSSFNYIVQGAVADPNKLERVTLSLRLKDSAAYQGPSQPRPDSPGAVVAQGSSAPLRGLFKFSRRRSQRSLLPPPATVVEKK
jgi:hypothetical protein